MAEKYISQVAVQNETYKIKDAELRTDIYAAGTGLSAQVTKNTGDIAVNAGKIADIEKAIAGGVHYIGKSMTELEDGSTTNPIIIDDGTTEGKEVTAVAGDLTIYAKKEFVFDGTKWNEFGDITGLGKLAFKDDVSAEYTPAGGVTVADKAAVDLTCSTGFIGTALSVLDGVTCKEVSATASFSGTQLTGVGATIEMNETETTASFDGEVQPTGSSTVTVTTATGAFAGNAGTVTVSGTATGTCTAPTVTVTQNKKSVLETAMVAEGTETLSFGTVEVLSSVTDITATAPTFSGTSFSSTGTFTPEGTVTTSQNVLTCNLTLNKVDVNGSVTVAPFTPSVKTAVVDNFTPAGSITVAPFTPQTETTTKSVTPEGTVTATVQVPSHSHGATFAGTTATITAQ